MPIRSSTSADGGELTLTLSNGELKALREIMAHWRFKDEKSLIEFALAVLVTPGLIIAKRDGEQMLNVEPDDSLLTSPPSHPTPPDGHEDAQ